MTDLSARLARAPVWASPALILFGALGCLATIAVADPTSPGNLLPRCPLRVTTGLWCPFCGSTRMLYALLHGHLGAAAHYNIVALAALPFLGYAYLGYAVRRLAGRRLPGTRLSPKIWWGIAFGLVVFGILRNVPYSPFTSLRG